MDKKIEKVIDKIVSNLEAGTIHEQLLKSIVDELGPEIGVTGGRLWKLDYKDYVLVEQYRGRKKISSGFRITETYPPIQTLRQEGYVCHEKSDRLLDRDLEDKLGVEDFVAVAIGIDASHIASFDTTTEIAAGAHPEILERQERTLRRIARTTAIALDNAYRHQQALKERDFAYRILLDMLPDGTPRFSDFDIYGKIIYSTEVGGDYYNFIKLPNANMNLVIADAKGHGLHAAATISLLHNALLRSIVRTEAQINESITKLNKKLCKRTSDDNFVTAFYAELSTEGQLTYCNAGHPPPLLFHEQNVEELNTGGPILGFLRYAGYEIAQIQLNKGDILVQYTDGIVEAVNQEEEQFGVQRLIDVVWENYNYSAEKITNELFDAVESFSETQIDDMTVVVTKRET